MARPLGGRDARLSSQAGSGRTGRRYFRATAIALTPASNRSKRLLSGSAQNIQKTVKLPRLSAYSFRHKVATVLRKARLSEDEIGMQLGHRREGARTTAGYGEWDPAYLKGVADALDTWFVQLGRKVKNKTLFPVPATEFRPFHEQRRLDIPGVLPGGPNHERIFGGKVGRRERIRTSGPYVPNVVLYQAELLSDTSRERGPLASGGALITMPPCPRNRRPESPAAPAP